MKLKSLYYNTMIYIVTDVLVKALPFFLIPIVTRFLSVEQYGNISLILSTIEILTILIICGTQSFYRYCFFNDKYNNDQVFISSILISLMMLSVFFVFLLFIFDGWLKLLPIVSFFQAIISITICHYQLSEKPIKIGMINISLALLSFITTIMFLFFGLGFNGRLLSVIICPIIIGIACLYLFKDKVKIKIVDSFILKKSFIFGIKSLPSSLSWWLRSGADRFIIQYFLGAVYVGYFSLSVQVSLIFSVVSIAINNSFSPKILKYTNERSFREVCLIIFKAFSLIIVVGSLIYIMMPIFFKILPNKFLASKEYILPLLLGIAMHGLFLISSNILIARNKPGFLSLVSIFSAVIHVIISILASKFIGLNGVVWSGFISYIISITILIIFLKKDYFNDKF
ncbi:oligosaccharide flippase family protein [Aliivibrio fischeri]|uniref:lipopolysaccharide biosynthesis protein n=1 Tax=Aliivibrio fischeri TaxID=668 RepID=UPI0012DA5914|nr:oligosaccharide flippase family protein [Aliivibrio fischeri]MUL05923.1 oligosaccharide flippase family protein [Aliivibrio fischeri]